MKLTIGKLIRVCASYYLVGCEICPFYKYNCRKYLNALTGRISPTFLIELKEE